MFAHVVDATCLNRIESLIGVLALQFEEDTGFGSHDELAAGAGGHVLEHGSGGAGEVGEFEDVGGAFRMGDHLGRGVADSKFKDVVGEDSVVNAAGTVPQDHVTVERTIDVGAEVSVGGKDDPLVFWQRLHDAQGVARSDDNIGHGLYLGGAVDVAKHRVTRIVLKEFSESLSTTAIGEGAAGFEVGNEDFLGGIEDFGGFGHEVDAGEEDDVGISGGGLLRKGEAVAYEIGNLLNFRTGVIMRKNNGVFLFFKT